MPGVMQGSTEESGGINDVCIKIIHLALSWTVEGIKELSRGLTTHDEVILTNQGSKEEGTTAMTNSVLRRAMVQPCYGPNCFLGNGRHRQGGNPGNQKIKEEDQGRVSWLPFGDSKKRCNPIWSGDRLPG